MTYKVKDHFYKKAKSEDYRARSVYKLKEIDERFKIFKSGQRVLDLGSAPGSWVQYISKVVKSKGIVVGVDLKDLKGDFPQNVFFIKKSIYDLEEKDFKDVKGKFDIVSSDMAPSTTGYKDVDQEASLDLCRGALRICTERLNKNGHFVFKIFQSSGVKPFLGELKIIFKNVQIIKPKSTRKVSSEIFIVAMGFIREDL